METEIEKELMRTEFESQQDLKVFTTKLQVKIQEYEQMLYDEENFTEAERQKIKRWRQKLYDLVRANNIVKEEDDACNELEKTVKVVHRQIQKADTNQALLDSSTLKLMGLNYSNADIEKIVEETKKRIQRNKSKEKQEINFIIGAFIIFICVCLLILFDKFVTN